MPANKQSMSDKLHELLKKRDKTAKRETNARKADGRFQKSPRKAR